MKQSWILSIVLAIALILSCIRYEYKINKISNIESSDTIYITTIDTINLTIYDTIPRIDRVVDTIIKNLDTTNLYQKYIDIFKNHNRLTYYNDTIRKDSLTIHISEEVFQNSLRNRVINFNYKNPQTQTVITNTKSSNGIYIGAEYYNGFGLGVYYQKNNLSYHVKYNIENKYTGIGIYYKIKKTK